MPSVPNEPLRRRLPQPSASPTPLAIPDYGAVADRFTRSSQSLSPDIGSALSQLTGVAAGVFKEIEDVRVEEQTTAGKSAAAADARTLDPAAVNAKLRKTLGDPALSPEFRVAYRGLMAEETGRRYDVAVQTAMNAERERISLPDPKTGVYPTPKTAEEIQSAVWNDLTGGLDEATKKSFLFRGELNGMAAQSNAATAAAYGVAIRESLKKQATDASVSSATEHLLRALDGGPEALEGPVDVGGIVATWAQERAGQAHSDGLDGRAILLASANVLKGRMTAEQYADFADHLAETEIAGVRLDSDAKTAQGIQAIKEEAERNVERAARKFDVTNAKMTEEASAAVAEILDPAKVQRDELQAKRPELARMLLDRLAHASPRVRFLAEKELNAHIDSAANSSMQADEFSMKRFRDNVTATDEAGRQAYIDALPVHQQALGREIVTDLAIKEQNFGPVLDALRPVLQDANEGALPFRERLTALTARLSAADAKNDPEAIKAVGRELLALNGEYVAFKGTETQKIKTGNVLAIGEGPWSEVLALNLPADVVANGIERRERATSTLIRQGEAEAASILRMAMSSVPTEGAEQEAAMRLGFEGLQERARIMFDNVDMKEPGAFRKAKAQMIETFRTAVDAKTKELSGLSSVAGAPITWFGGDVATVAEKADRVVDKVTALKFITATETFKGLEGAAARAELLNGARSGGYINADQALAQARREASDVANEVGEKSDPASITAKANALRGRYVPLASFGEGKLFGAVGAWHIDLGDQAIGREFQPGQTLLFSSRKELLDWEAAYRADDPAVVEQADALLKFMDLESTKGSAIIARVLQGQRSLLGMKEGKPTPPKPQASAGAAAESKPTETTKSAAGNAAESKPAAGKAAESKPTEAAKVPEAPKEPTLAERQRRRMDRAYVAYERAVSSGDAGEAKRQSTEYMYAREGYENAKIGEAVVGALGSAVDAVKATPGKVLEASAAINDFTAGLFGNKPKTQPKEGSDPVAAFEAATGVKTALGATDLPANVTAAMERQKSLGKPDIVVDPPVGELGPKDNFVRFPQPAPESNKPAQTKEEARRERTKQEDLFRQKMRGVAAQQEAEKIVAAISADGFPPNSYGVYDMGNGSRRVLLTGTVKDPRLVAHVKKLNELLGYAGK